MRAFKFAIVIAVFTSLEACAATTPTSKVAVDYNRIFAKAQNEVLVTNILRASEREPLQFSTMGSVTGGVRNTGAIDLTIPSLIGRGATILSPDISVNEGINPNVSIVPLSSKEFTEGILRPVSADEINYFINQSWDPELILELVVGGIVCPDGNVVFNRGVPGAGGEYDAFAKMFANADRFPIQPVSKPSIKILRMSASEAISVMKDGVGNGRTVESIDPVIEKGKNTGSVDVTIASIGTEAFHGIRTLGVCSRVRNDRGERPLAPTQGIVRITPIDGEEQGKVILRSVESIIYFLGETQRWRWGNGPLCDGTEKQPWPYYSRFREIGGVRREEQLGLLSIDRVCAGRPVPSRTFVQTHFNDADYYLLRQSDAGNSDRSLSTMSFLAELIALQTSESTITAGSPIIAIGSK